MIQTYEIDCFATVAVAFLTSPSEEIWSASTIEMLQHG
jgi:hypothetical protein